MTLHDDNPRPPALDPGTNTEVSPPEPSGVDSTDHPEDTESDSPTVEEPTPELESAEDTSDIGAVIEAVSQMDSRLLDINDLIIKRLSYDKAKEEAFERLYADLDAHKEDRLFDLLRPLFFDLILLRDRVENGITDETADADHGKFLQSISDELLEVLMRRGVERIDTVNTTFDPALQQAIGVKETANPDEHNLISEVIRSGFRYGKRIVRPEEVMVLKYSEPKIPDEPQESE